MLFANADIAKVIDLAVAPVFLLTAISGALNVLSVRMGRIIDRGRKLNETQVAPDDARAEEIDQEQSQLALRAKLIQRAIMMSTLSALFVCFVIILLFIDVLFEFQLQLYIACTFMVALGCLSFSLLTFLREIDMSAMAFHFGKYRAAKRKK
jgi:hypothetical protein